MDRPSPIDNEAHGPGRRAPAMEPHGGMPRWVKGFAIVGLVVVALLLVLRFTGGHGPGGHGPGGHGSTTDAEAEPAVPTADRTPHVDPGRFDVADGGIQDLSRWDH